MSGPTVEGADVEREMRFEPSAGPARVLALASGKGGVGKTSLAVNLAVTLARETRRVALLDADLGLANVDVLLGLAPHASVSHVLRGERGLRDVVVEGPEGVRIIPAASGLSELTVLTAAQQLTLLDEVDAFAGEVDVLLVDTAAGITPTALYFAAAANETVVVTTPEPTALADAYALVKLLATRHGRRRFVVVVNMAHHRRDAEMAYARLARVAARFLQVELEYGGFVPFDDAVRYAVRRQQPVVTMAPTAPSAVAIAALARRLATRPRAGVGGGMQFFFRQLVGEGRTLDA